MKFYSIMLVLMGLVLGRKGYFTYILIWIENLSYASIICGE